MSLFEEEERRTCSACLAELPRAQFSGSQWKKEAGRRCAPCTAAGAPAAPPPSLAAAPRVHPDRACLSMHQPYASLLVHGIKRLEGREWGCDFRGPLWIHAASRRPEPDEIAAVEAHYRTLWALDADAPEPPRFPEHYPVSCVLGRVSVVACVTQSQLRRAAHRLVPSLRDESGSSFAFCCERPQMLPLPVAGRSGEHKIWELTSAEAKGFSLALVDARPPSETTFPPLEAFGPLGA